MAEHVTIEKIADQIGKEVTIKGWLYAKTGKGKLQFLQVRDGTGIIQCVVLKKEVSQEAFDTTQQLTQESSLTVTGRVRADMLSRHENRERVRNAVEAVSGRRLAVDFLAGEALPEEHVSAPPPPRDDEDLLREFKTMFRAVEDGEGDRQGGT